VTRACPSVALLGAPSSSGANAAGLERAPAHLRRCGLLAELSERGLLMHDAGDIVSRRYRTDRQNPTARNLAAVVDSARDVGVLARGLFAQGRRLLLLGGDCTVTCGLVSAAVEYCPRLGLLYVDSQTDLNTPAETTTGILDSMGLAHMLGAADNALSRLGNAFPMLDPKSVVAFGFHPERINEVENRLLSDFKISSYPAPQITGAVEMHATEALARMEDRCDAYLVHFDVDVIDFSAFPVADAPVYRGFGLEFQEALSALSILCRSSKCLGLAITEFNPDRDEDGAFGRQLVRALGDALSGWAAN
jgi:arginase